MSLNFISAFTSEDLQLLWAEVGREGEAYLKVRAYKLQRYTV